MIRRLETFDIGKIKVQKKQEHYRNHINKLAISGLLYDSYVYVESGEVKAAIGMQPIWTGRSAVWAIIGAINNWVAFHRQVKSIMKIHIKKNNLARVELTTEEGFHESERWARLLGFEFESLMLNYGIDGKNHKMWVKICPVL